MTQYPIKASIVLRGLLRPAILLSPVKINVYIYGRKDVSSGLYAITNQEDSISESGITTTLQLIRISGDEYVN